MISRMCARSTALLPDWPSPNTSRCGSVSGSSPTGASSFSLMPSSSSVSGIASRLAWSRTVSRAMCSGSSRSFGPVGPRHASTTRAIRSSTPSPTVSEVVSPSIRGQCAEEVELALHQAAARASGRDQLGDLAVDLGVHGVAEPQLEPGAEDVAHRGPEVGPARGGGDDVEAEGEAAGRELLDLHLDVVEVRAQRRPAVDDEEDVAVPVVGTALRAARAVGLDRVDALLAEVRLAAVDDALHLGHDPAYDVGLGAGADARDVRQPDQRGERAATEVEHEELRLLRRRGQRHAGDDRAQQRALAAARAADDRDVPGGAAEVDRQRVAALLARTVDGAERDDQARARRATAARPGRAGGRP